MSFVKRIFYTVILIVGFSFELFSGEVKSKPTVCLNMIVKNESLVIERCLASMLPVIDYWVIVDTGSTDGTQDIIKNFMKAKGVPGELHERPWKNFGHNRQEALDFARKKADYVFFIDADEQLIYEPDFKLPCLDKDFYFVNISHSGSLYARILLIKNSLNWNWRGVLHEYVGCEEAVTNERLEKVYNLYGHDGARSKDPEKYLKDAMVLEEGIKEEPDNSRYVFYLAQSYKDGGKYEKAIEVYERRVAMGGWDQEVFWSLYQIAIMKEHLAYAEADVIQAYERAYNFRKSRLEPLYHMVHYLREKGNFKTAYTLGKQAQQLPCGNDLLFQQQWMFDYGLDLELSIAAYWIGEYEECLSISENILKRSNIPESVQECVARNMNFAKDKIIENVGIKVNESLKTLMNSY